MNGKTKEVEGEEVSESTDLVEKQETSLIPADITPDSMLAMAVQQGSDIESIRELLKLKREWEADEAKKAYVVAMNAFKKNPPEIFKDQHVSYTTDKGTTEYDHASLSNVVKTIGQALAKHGLSHRWDMDTLEGGVIKVTCVITHKDGHSESVPMQGGADKSGGKNEIQAKGSTITYFQRYTLLAATGLATAGQDDDGRGSEPVEYITEEQVADLTSLMDEVKADKAAFLRYANVTALCYIKAEDYMKAQTALEAKRGQ